MANNSVFKPESFAGRDGPTVKRKITLIGKQVLIQVIRPPGRTHSGIYIPQQSQHPETELDWVIAVGPECKQVKEGDLVLTPAGQMAKLVQMQGVEMILLTEDQIGGIIDDPKEYMAWLDEHIPLDVDVRGENNPNNHSSIRNKKIYKG